MNIFDLLIIQPIFNLLVVIYSIVPGSDFGISLIIFTVIVRLAMWPLVKKQLHQTRIQREIQPELKKIKAKAKGDKQLEGRLMLELYRERGISPFSGIGVIFLQLPIFIALYSVINIITQHRDQIAKFTYDVVEQLGPIHEIIHSTNHYFNESLLGLVNLSKTALDHGTIYWPLMILAVLSAVLQYYQSKQITPQPTERKRLRDIMAASAAGKEVDPAEASAIMSRNMILIFPVLTFVVMIYLPGAISLYTVVSSLVAIVQQRAILRQDVNEMEILADKPTTKKRVLKAQEAEVVMPVVPPRRPRGKKRSKRS